LDKVIKFLLTAAVAGISFGAVAAPDKGSTPVEQHLASQGVKIVQSFTSASGLRAIVADNGTEKRMFYITPDGKSLIVGMVFDAQGNNITSADMNKAGVSDVGGAKVMGDAQLQALWDRVEKRRWVQEGKSGKVIYAFFDANCPYCHRLWSTLRAGVQAGKIQVRWLPVAILKDTSKGLGAAIYSAANPSDALARMVNRQLQPVSINERDNRDMALNLLLLRDTGYTGVPTLMFKRGTRIVSMMGAPDDKELAALLQ